MRNRPLDTDELDFDDLLEAHGECEGPWQVFKIEGELAQAAAVAAIHLLQAGLARRLVRSDGCVHDEDVLELIGVALDLTGDGKAVSAALRDAMAQQLEQLASRGRRQTNRLKRNLGVIGRLLSFGEAELGVLELAVLRHHAPLLGDLFRVGRTANLQGFQRLLARALKVSERSIVRALGRDSPLRLSGLLDPLSGGALELADLIELDPRVAEALLKPKFKANDLLDAVARKAPPPTLKLTNFPHQRPEIETALCYLEACRRDGRKGVNLLIHGAPGVGKTELARLLLRSAGLQAFEVPAEDRDGDPTRAGARLGAFITCQQLLAASPQPHAVIFDEIEDVFPAADPFGMRVTGERAPKRFVNNVLEGAPVPSVWIANAVRQIDPAYQRRFDLVIEVRTLPASERLKLLRLALDGVPLPRGTLEACARIEDLSPALIQTNGRVLRAVSGTDPKANAERLRLIVEHQLNAAGRSVSWPVIDETAGPWRMDWLNPSQPLQPILEGIARSRRGRLCLFGPPGTGKTALAHHLGQLIQRPVVAVRASDLLSKWVGETEQQIAAAFARARSEDAILLIDEADSMLGSRKGAQRSWELTRVNEMLTQMESFEGIFIASTNLAERLDEASLRRFDFKLRFDPPLRSQRAMMVWESHQRLLQPESNPADPPATLPDSFERLDGLCPGDTAAARRQCHITAERPTLERWISILQQEIDARRSGNSRPIGFMA